MVVGKTNQAPGVSRLCALALPTTKATRRGIFYLGDVMAIKAIPTKYNGVEYRSRTEARWALFFDLAEIDFQYEREGYQTKKGWYVPDFWLPNSQCWIEIKGTPEDHAEHMDKLREVCEETNSYGFVFVGPPQDMYGSFVGCDTTDSGSGGEAPSWFDAGLATDGRNAAETFRVNIGGTGRVLFDASFSEKLDCVCVGNFRDEWEESVIQWAAIEAAKHRFW